jgi:4-amino-4-deoxy-L-arabinose transferase-like glycosyltransferase
MLSDRDSGATGAGISGTAAGSVILKDAFAEDFSAPCRVHAMRLPAWLKVLSRTALPKEFWLAAALIVLRFLLAQQLPLSFDEAYFWLWSKHLALAYYDHPALIALAIRAGTSIGGDTEFGVRLVPLLCSIAASWAVWRSALLLLGDKGAAWTACLLFNATLMVAAESMSATPDSLVLAAAAFLLLAMAKLELRDHPGWWIAAGLATGLALFAKYTGFFLFGGVALWLVATPQGRRWLRTPWPYLGGAVALSFLAPTLYWNAQHDWISFKFQFGRVVAGSPSFGHLLEFVGGQLVLASPFVAALAVAGLIRQSRRPGREPLSFAAALVWPALAYFGFHALHDRVQGNWPSFIYPALVLLAVSTVVEQRHAMRHLLLTKGSLNLAVPAALAILLVVYAQAFFGILPLGEGDPIARMMGVGFRPVAVQIAEVAREDGAVAIATTKYATTAWLAFYRASPIPIVQLNEDNRFLSSPRATAGMLRGPLLYVTEHPERDLPWVEARFDQVKFVVIVDRMRNGILLDKYYAFLLAGHRGAPIGRVPVGLESAASAAP